MTLMGNTATKPYVFRRQTSFRPVRATLPVPFPG